MFLYLYYNTMSLAYLKKVLVHLKIFFIQVIQGGKGEGGIPGAKSLFRSKF